MAIPVTIGIAFGFFISCSSVSPVSNRSESQTEASLDSKELEKRLRQVERQIGKSPRNAEVHFRKGDLLNQLAHRQSAPSERVPHYTDMKRALAEAATFYRSAENQEGAGKVDELLKVSWSFEHNRGVEIMQTDSTLRTDDFDRAAAHFNNAILIIPDSVVSYKMKANAHYRNHEVDEAVSTLETARQRIDARLPTEMLEQLAFLYLEQDRPDQAVEMYERAESFSNDNLNLIHGLANAYITAGRHDRAMNLLKALVENEPENIIYLQSYGTELYHLGIKRYESLLAGEPEEPMVIRREAANADTLINRAKTQYQKALKLNPDNTEIKKLLATLYQNYAIQLRRAKSLFPAGDRSTIEQRVKQHLSSAVPLFEQLVDNNPEMTQYWKSLYQAYSYLGMPQKASEAKAKANL